MKPFMRHDRGIEGSTSGLEVSTVDIPAVARVHVATNAI